LVDLPGLIRTVSDDEDASLITKVQNLVDKYIVQSRTVILAVAPANVDIHNIEILQKAATADPKGLRTVSIITKPDLIDEGAEGSVFSMAQNETKQTKNGYHIVKCRGQKDLNDGVSIAKGLDKEVEYFKSHPIWNKLPESSRGISSLKLKLVEIFEETIMTGLPSVLREIESKLKTCEMELDELGPAMNSSYEKRMSFNQKTDIGFNRIAAALEGNYVHDSKFFENEITQNKLRAVMRKEEEKFQKEVQAINYEQKMKPKPFLEVGDRGRFIENDEEFEYVEPKDDMGKIQVKNVGTEKKEDRSKKDWIPNDQVSNLEFIKELIRENRGLEIPLFPSYPIFVSLVQSIISKWEVPALALFNQNSEILFEGAKKFFMQSTLNAKLQNFLIIALKTTFDNVKLSAEKALQEMIEKEMTPYTLNHYLFDNIIKARSKPLMDSLDKLTGSIDVSVFKQILENHGVGHLSNEDNEAKEIELAIMAYLKVAKKRFTDNVPMLIQSNFVKPFLKELKQKLVTDDKTLDAIFMEKKSVVRERTKLLKKKQALVESKDAVTAL
jgi:interferon-induced GTP-binding protein Mx1